MGYYAPSFGNLCSGWYWTTSEKRYADERDACIERWNEQCDKIVARYLRKYGMFLLAFERDIKSEIRALVDSPFPFPDYFAYFILSKVLFDPVLSKQYTTDYEARSQLMTSCEICGARQQYDNIHPSLIGRTKTVLPLCNSCWFILSDFTDLSIISEIPVDFRAWFAQLMQEQKCAVCGRGYVWVKKPSDTAKMYGATLIPGRHLHICPLCVQKAVLESNTQDDLPTNLARFRNIAETIGAIPDKSGFIYNQIGDPQTAVLLTGVMHKMLSFHDLSKACNSWFKLLIASGILPQGTRRTKYGTMVLAQDGHECLSIAEKQLDDLLHSKGIAHTREPSYPNSNFRADWLITVDGQPLFIEFFGLYGQKQYTRRMTDKLAFAKANGIRVVSFIPKDLNNLSRAFSVKVLSLLT